MKKSVFTILAGLALAIPAQAGTTYIAPDPAPSSGLWGWFAGGSVGYLSDLEEGMYTLHVGAEYKNSSARGTHAIYLEVGFTQDSASYRSNPPPGMTGGRTERSDLDLDIIPITLNYKYEAPVTECLNYYVGLGAGLVILDSSYDWSWSQAVAPPHHQGHGSSSQSETRFYGHVFAGLTYDLSDSFEVFGGVRYIFMDDHDMKISMINGPSHYNAGIDGDVLFELGVRYNF